MKFSLKTMRLGWSARCAAVVLLGLATLAGVGCQSSPSKPGPAVATGPVVKPLPPVASVVAAQNERVHGLDTLWARISLRVDGKLANAKLNKEEAEGYLQVVLPNKVAVSINKLGNTYFYLGSNDALYWWFDLTGDQKVFAGRHASATPETVDRFGVPVHPLDLIELLAITPIPATGQPGSPEKLHWSADGSLIWYDVAARGSTKRVLIDPKTYMPVMVELLDKTGKVVVRSELSKYVAFASRSIPGANPSVASRCIIKVPRQDLTITINVNDPGSGTPDGRPIKELAFNFEYLAKKAYPKAVPVDLDKKEATDPVPDVPPADGAGK